MFKLLKALFRFSENGFTVPLIKDSVTGKPSITFTCAYFSFILMMVSLIGLHFKLQLVVATTASFFFWVTAMVLYMIRKINKAKIDVDDQSIEIENTRKD
jgi:hypothetical protein